MHQSTLNDAALALSRILSFNKIKHGFFGGWSVLACSPHAAYRESKDIDVLVAATKPTIQRILSQKRGWLEIPQCREDYVAFFWHDAEDSQSMVLVEMFVGHDEMARDQFPVSRNQVLSGPRMGTSYVPILKEEFLFRGKLSACATRTKSSDAADVDYLVRNYGKELKMAAKKMDKKTVGMAVRRHPELRKVLGELGVHTRGAVWGVRKARLDGQVQPQMWDVQRGLGICC
ncbi:hypothetical protein DFP73DRAFT_37274 [Morchella snyderi]|nr:hypothetical protein DFP73DRAFT_37274 [Morchella snyderi]